MKVLIAVFLACTFGLSQEIFIPAPPAKSEPADSPKRVLKEFVPPEPIAYFKGGYFLKDRACANDFANALALTSGLERERTMTDLVKYECAKRIAVSGWPAKVIGMAGLGDPNNPIQMRMIVLGVKPDREDFPEGWVLATELMTESQFKGFKPKLPENEAAMSALNALRYIRSGTDAGVTFPDFSQRVKSAKVVVEGFLNAATIQDEGVRTAIGLAMRYYEITGAAWAATIAPTNSTILQVLENIDTLLRNDPEFKSCSTLASGIAEVDAQWKPQAKPGVLSYLIGKKPAYLWACASIQVAAAERLLVK
jgi:hypothetical protein